MVLLYFTTFAPLQMNGMMDFPTFRSSAQNLILA